MRFGLVALILACLLTACGDGGCDWPQVPQKETHVPTKERV